MALYPLTSGGEFPLTSGGEYPLTGGGLYPLTAPGTADRLLIETSATDGYLLEDGSGVLVLQ